MSAAGTPESGNGGWFKAGVVVQCALWAGLWLALIAAWYLDMPTTEFRYVGF